MILFTYYDGSQAWLTEEQVEVAKKDNARQIIEACKKELSAIDYKTIKRMQGELPEEEWVETVARCKSLREEIKRQQEIIGYGNEDIE